MSIAFQKRQKELKRQEKPGKDAKDRAVLIIAGIAAIAIGVGMMRWVFGGAVLVSAVVGIAAAAHGVSLIVSGIHERTPVAAQGNP
jgi:uncharacterized membrane protein HdeD (DUF308 family)